MTNAQIIEEAQELLLADGVLHENEDGEIQAIHTYQIWKKLGFQVKKGETAIVKLPIWKCVNNKKQAEEEADDKGEIEQKGRKFFFKKMSAFFTDEQVEKIQVQEG